MKRFVLRLVFAGLVLIGAGIVWAEDTVYIQEPGKKSGDSLKGTIEEETPSGIKLKTSSGIKDIPTSQITQVAYQCKVVAVEFRRPDGQLIRALAEKSADERTKLLRSALSGFQDLELKLKDEPKVHRYLQYRIALTQTALAKDDPARRDAAIAILKENQKSFADGWEIVPALQLLARLQEEKGDVEAAGQAYSDLAAVPGISAAMKLDSQLHGSRLLLSAKKFTDAEAKLKEVAAALPADDPQRAQVDIYLAQARIAQNRLDGIEKKLKDAITANEDKKLRALAHNALGDYYLAKKEPERAFWEYLKVETMYDVDREEQAKALYWLSKLFDQPKNDPARAEECLTKLQGQRFDGTPYQRKAASEKKSP
jgi:hypothetical protein